LLALFSFALASGEAQLPANDGDQLLEQARAAVQYGRYDQASRLLKKALATRPDFTDANLLLAATYLKLGEPVRAIRPAQAALRKDPASRVAKLTLADALLESNRVAEALGLFAGLVLADSPMPEAWYGLVKASLVLARRAEGRLQVQAPRSLYWKALRMTRTRSQDEAAETYRELLKSNPESSGIWEGLGEYAFTRGNFSEARACFLKSLRWAPWSPRSAFGLVCLDLAERKLDAAVERLNQTATINSAWLEVRGPTLLPAGLLDQITLLKDRGGRTQPAARFVASVLNESEGEALPLNSVQESTAITPVLQSCFKSFDQTRCWVEAGFAEIAFLKALKILCSQGPASPEIHYWRVIGFERLGSMALDHLVGDASGRQLTLAAQIFMWLKEYSQAAELLNRALRLEPTNGEAWTALGKVQRHNVELEKAEISLLKGLQFNHIDAEAQFMLGEIYAKRHEPKKALVFLERSLELHPPSDAARVILAKIYGQLGEDSKQIAQLLMIPSERRSPPILYQLYQAYQRTGQTLHAQEILIKYRRSRKGQPDQKSLEPGFPF